ncbi:MAG: hypothetical protein U0R44_00605 [Candidatus Micrarchaeia archaeon]
MHIGKKDAIEPSGNLRRAVFTGILAAGIMGSPLSCGTQLNAAAPPAFQIKEILSRPPMGIAEETNEQGSSSPLRGLFASCRGKPVCRVIVSPGDLVIVMPVMPEVDGNLEVAVDSLTGSGIRLRKRVTAKFQDTSEEYQEIAFGSAAALFNTDLRVRAEKDEFGRFFLNVE